jgi:oligopeptide/dipeptide ABC transporter ATP-binding protein
MTELIRLVNLKKHFPVRKGILRKVKAHVKAVDGVSFSIGEKETIGLVGESGCGKTTAGRTILKLLEPTDGLIEYRGHNITRLNSDQMRPLRKKLQIIFQDPYASLNPRMTVGRIIREGLDIHKIGEKNERDAMVAEVLERVGLPRNILDRYPHEFSGGQRQRVGIARALILKPEFIVCDEAISALDVSIQAQIINLLADLKEEYGIAYLFIAHDLSVVEHISDRVAVMYLGKIVELAETKELFSNPLHPYTRALLSSVPKPDPTLERKRIVLEGDVPSPIAPPSGCSFHPRCPLAVEGLCDTKEPNVVESNGHQFACHVVEEELSSGQRASPQFPGLRPREW